MDKQHEMINQQLLLELKTILKEEYKLDLEDQDVKVVGNQLINSCESLIKLLVEEDT